MAFNAIDGMLAREFGQKSRLGAYLNELTDVASDAALYLPFALLPPFSPLWTGIVIVLAVISEFAGVLGPMVGASRRYDGPMGKSDRAFVFGALGLWIGLANALPDWAAYVMPLLAAALAWTIANRVRAAWARSPGEYPHARFARCPPRGQVNPLGRPGGIENGPHARCARCPPRGRVNPLGRPGGMENGPHARFARCPPRGQAQSLGTARRD